MSDLAILIQQALINIEEEHEIVTKAHNSPDSEPLPSRLDDNDYYDYWVQKGMSHERAYDMVLDRWYASHGY